MIYVGIYEEYASPLSDKYDANNPCKPIKKYVEFSVPVEHPFIKMPFTVYEKMSVEDARLFAALILEHCDYVEEFERTKDVKQ